MIHPYELKPSRNEPLYLFTDSIDFKYLLINLLQVGNTSILEKPHPHPDEPPLDIGDSSCDEQDVCLSIILEKTKLAKQVDSASNITAVSWMMEQFNTKPVHMVLEKYTWNVNCSDGFGSCKGNIRTFGSKSLIIDLGPGRFSFRYVHEFILKI